MKPNKPPLNVLTVKQLREEAVKAGMPKEDAEKFEGKPPLIATINALRAANAAKKVEKVKTLNPPEDPKEERLTERRWRGKAEKMRAKLEGQPKIRYFIPLEGEEKPGVVREVVVKGRKEFVHVSGAIETVQLNGYKTLIPKGRFVNLPQQVAEVLSASVENTQKAGEQFLATRPDPNTGKEVGDKLS
jgi:hypothetical protein